MRVQIRSGGEGTVSVKVQSVWPGGMVELPEFRLAGDPVVSPWRNASGDACATRPEGLAAVILGLAWPGLNFHGHEARPGLDRENSPRCNREVPGPGRGNLTGK